MYSFAQRSDTIVIDEPLYAHYLARSNADHPGREEVIRSMESDGEKVVNEIILGNYEKEIVFMKQMTHHLIDIDESFLEKVTNVFLIRNPKQLISSLAQVLNKVEMKDTGIKRQAELYQKLKLLGFNPVVIDSGEILKNPESALKNFCRELHIPFEKSMLSWKPGKRKEDGVWAKYWYENVHRSSGFEKQVTSDRELPDELIPLYNECLPFYKKLSDNSVKAF